MSESERSPVQPEHSQPSDAAQVGGGPCAALMVEALTVGGAEQMMVALANGLVARGWRVHMICLAQAGELAARLDSAVTQHVLAKHPGLDRRLPGRLRSLVNRLQPDVVNSHLWVANLWTRVSLLGHPVPVIVTEHSRDSWKSGPYRLADRWLARCTARLVAVSHDTAAFYRDEIGVPATKVTVINNGVDTRRYAGGDGTALRAQWAPDGQALIGTVGRLVSAKNHPRLVACMARLRQRGVPVTCVVVGEGPERARLEQSIAAGGLADHVLLAGARSDIGDVLAALDVFVLSSDREGHPLTALEAQAAGTPVVLTDVGGCSDAIAREGDQVGGLLVPADPGLLAEALAGLLGDAARRQQMARFGQRYAQVHFDIAQMVAHYEQVFAESIKASINA